MRSRSSRSLAFNTATLSLNSALLLSRISRCCRALSARNMPSELLWSCPSASARRKLQQHPNNGGKATPKQAAGRGHTGREVTAWTLTNFPHATRYELSCRRKTDNNCYTGVILQNSRVQICMHRWTRKTDTTPTVASQSNVQLERCNTYRGTKQASQDAACFYKTSKSTTESTVPNTHVCFHRHPKRARSIYSPHAA